MTKSFKPLKDLPEKIDEETALKGYILVDQNEWTKIPKNTHIRYKEMDASPLRSGFIHDFKNYETPEKKWIILTLKNALYNKEGKILYWNKNLNEIADIWKKNIKITSLTDFSSTHQAAAADNELSTQTFIVGTNPDIEKIQITLENIVKRIDNMDVQIIEVQKKNTDMENIITSLVDKLIARKSKN
jgi:hypothetical protein